MIKTKLLLIFGLLFTSCSSLETGSSTRYLPDTFTTENLLSTYMGMTSDEVLGLYGEPKNINQSMCGSDTEGGAWSCTTWEYGRFPYDRARIVFNSNDEIMTINHFNITRSRAPLPKSFTTQNIMKVRQGMEAAEVIMLFGAPRNVSQTTCGTATDNPWLCTTWEYGSSSHGNASFTFSFGEETMLLNDFKIKRD